VSVFEIKAHECINIITLFAIMKSPKNSAKAVGYKQEKVQDK
jgi:hypothetical protein